MSFLGPTSARHLAAATTTDPSLIGLLDYPLPQHHHLLHPADLLSGDRLLPASSRQRCLDEPHPPDTPLQVPLRETCGISAGSTGRPAGAGGVAVVARLSLVSGSAVCSCPLTRRPPVGAAGGGEGKQSGSALRRSLRGPHDRRVIDRAVGGMPRLVATTAERDANRNASGNENGTVDTETGSTGRARDATREPERSCVARLGEAPSTNRDAPPSDGVRGRRSAAAPVRAPRPERPQVSRRDTCKGMSGGWGWSEERCRDRDGTGVWLSAVGRDCVEAELGEGVGGRRWLRWTRVGTWPLKFGSSRRVSRLRWRLRSSTHAAALALT